MALGARTNQSNSGSVPSYHARDALCIPIPMAHMCLLWVFSSVTSDWAVGVLIFLEMQFGLVFVWDVSQGQLSCHSSQEEEREDWKPRLRSRGQAI